MVKRIRIATRQSELARWQANWVARLLNNTGVDVQMVYVTTHGDIHQSGPVESIGTQGVFTKEVQRAVLDGEADLAVHSLKDLPTEPTEGLSLAAVPARAPVLDCLVSSRYDSLDEIPQGTVIGTGSLRRKAQLLAYARTKQSSQDSSAGYCYWDVQTLRGNLQTRLNKLDGEDYPYEAIILAEAGLRRLDQSKRIAQIIPASVLMPAAGQGALGLEIRAEDTEVRKTMAEINDAAAFLTVTAERAMLSELNGGCLAPIGVYSVVQGCQLTMTGRVIECNGLKTVEDQQSISFDLDASNRLRINDRTCEEAFELGSRIAENLIQQGAQELIQAARDAETKR